MKKQIFIILILLTLVSFVNAASLSLSLNSLDAIVEGENVTLTATVSAVGDSVSNVSLELGSLPSGLTTSDSLVQSAGTLSSGQSTSKSWTIRGDVADTYTLNVTASGTSVSDVFHNPSLVVNTAGYIEVSNKSCSTTSVSANGTDTVTMQFSLRNTGGSTTTTTVNIENYSLFSLTTGSNPESIELAAGSQSTRTYVFTAESTAGSNTITARITSTTNNPADQTCSVTLTSAGGTTNNLVSTGGIITNNDTNANDTNTLEDTNNPVDTGPADNNTSTDKNDTVINKNDTVGDTTPSNTGKEVVDNGNGPIDITLSIIVAIIVIILIVLGIYLTRIKKVKLNL